MAEFVVTPEDMVAAAARLGSISGGVDELCGHLRGCAGAAAGTPAEGAFEGMLGHFSGVLPHFGLAGEHLGRAVAGAGTGYSASDAEVAGACNGSGARPLYGPGLSRAATTPTGPPTSRAG